jgi:hypothetical protein
LRELQPVRSTKITRVLSRNQTTALDRRRKIHSRYKLSRRFPEISHKAGAEGKGQVARKLGLTSA